MAQSHYRQNQLLAHGKKQIEQRARQLSKRGGAAELAAFDSGILQRNPQIAYIKRYAAIKYAIEIVKN